MSLKTRIDKLEKAVTTGEETNNVRSREIKIIILVSNRREVLLGEMAPDTALGDKVEKHTVPIFTSQVKSF